MRTVMIALSIIVLALGSCDPLAETKVRVDLPSSQDSGIEVLANASHVQEALALVHSVLTEHGFLISREREAADEDGCIRHYKLPGDEPLVFCSIKLTNSRVQVIFHELLARRVEPQVMSAAADLRAALVAKYGEKRVG